MKIPKELKSTQKKSHKMELILATFKRTFNDLNKKYLPIYSVVFKKMGERGKYSDLVEPGNSDEIVLLKEDNDIEIYLNWIKLRVVFNQCQAETHFRFLNNLYSQAAFHEYGHTYLITSAYTMLCPSEVIEYLNKIGIKTVWSLPPKYKKQIEKIYSNSPQTLRMQKLKNIKFIDIANGVCECHANYSVLHKLNDRLPKEFLLYFSQALIAGLHKYSKFDIKSIHNSALARNVIGWILRTGHLFVYDKLKVLDKYIEKYGFRNLSKFAHELNTKFLEIATSFDNIKPMKEEILNLAEKTDKVDFRTIMEKNH